MRIKSVFSLFVPLLLVFSMLTGCDSKNENRIQEHTHVFSIKTVDSTHLKEKATCTSPAEYYYSCSCGEISSFTTFNYGEPSLHSFSKKIEDKYLASKATKEHPAKYYYACSVCGARSTETFESGESLQDEWDYNYYVDNQFNEKTDEWYIGSEKLDGTFENSATNDADLLVEILYDCNDCISIFLYEYARENNLVKNSSSKYKDYYKIVVKNESGKTYEARGQMHPGEDRIYIIDTYHASVLKLMKTSKNLKFFIQSEDSPTTQYRFDVDMNNFTDLVKKMQKK